VRCRGAEVATKKFNVFALARVQHASGYLVAVNARKGWLHECQLHVLFGAGQVGRPLAQLLLDAGKRVRVAKRSPAGVPSGVEVIRGDAADPGFCAQAAEGAATVYDWQNPTIVWCYQTIKTLACRFGRLLAIFGSHRIHLLL
jgi:hypothetical protein